MALVQAVKAMLSGLWRVVDRLEKQITSQSAAEQDGIESKDESAKKR
jgi:hypothetical protein